MRSDAYFNRTSFADDGELMRAVESGDARRVASLLSAGVGADARDASGTTPLMRASSKGFADIVRLLIDAGADARTRRDDGFTPLLFAVVHGHTPVARLLLANGSDATARTRLGVNAMSFAAARGFDEMTKLLRESSSSRAVETATSGSDADEGRPTSSVRESSLDESGDGIVAVEGVNESDGVVEAVGGVNASARAGGRLKFSRRAATGLFLVALACGIGIYAFRRGVGQESSRQAPATPAQSAPTQTGASQPPPVVDSAPAPGATGAGQDGASQEAGTSSQPFGQSFVAPGYQSVVTEPQVSSPSSVRSVGDEATMRNDAPVSRRVGEESTGEGVAPRREDGARSRAPLSIESVPANEFQLDPAPSPVPSETPRRKVIQWPPA